MAKKKFKGAVLKPTVKHFVGDDWMRPDFIIVSKDFSPKELKPYQRLIVLRKPEGEVRCIVDKSLPYNEISRIQQKIDQVGFIDINSNEFTRIIPSDFKLASEKVFDIESNDVETNETVNEIKQLLDDFQKNEYSVNSFNEQKQNIYISSLIRLKDDSISISLKNDNKHEPEKNHDNLFEENKKNKKDALNDINIIDNVKIHIPHEEQLITWEQDDMDEIQQYNEALVESNNLLHQNIESNINDSQFTNQLIQEENQNEIEEEKIMYVGSEFDNSDENVVYHYDGSTDVNTEYKDYINQNSSVEEYDNHVNPYEYELNQVDNEQELMENVQNSNENLTSDYLVDGETNFYQDNDSDYIEENEPIQPIVQESFFKNKNSPEALMYGKNKNQYYSFYVDSNKGEYEKVYLNKKMNIYTFRKKIDKNLIASKNKKSFFGFFNKSK